MAVVVGLHFPLQPEPVADPEGFPWFSWKPPFADHSSMLHTSGVATGDNLGEKFPPKIVGVFIYYCNDVKKRPQRGCSIQLVATETADAIMAISVQGNYVIEITVKININE